MKEKLKELGITPNEYFILLGIKKFESEFSDFNLNNSVVSDCLQSLAELGLIEEDKRLKNTWRCTAKFESSIEDDFQKLWKILPTGSPTKAKSAYIDLLSNNISHIKLENNLDFWMNKYIANQIDNLSNATKYLPHLYTWLRDSMWDFEKEDIDNLQKRFIEAQKKNNNN